MTAHPFTQTDKQTSSGLALSSQATWEAWLQPIQSTSPVGDDLSYDDRFQAMREEVAKLSDINDHFILDTAEHLLKHVAKDMRVASYYAYGRLRRDGMEGWADSLELLALLVHQFGESLLPARIESRRAAIEWLTGNTMMMRLDHSQPPTDTCLQRIQSALALITACTATWPESARPELGALNRRFESEAATPRLLPSSASAPSASVHTASTSAFGPIESSRELLDGARQMAAYLRQQPQGHFAAWRLIRCARWDTLAELPPHEASGKTRLSAPRAEIRSHIKRLLLQKQWLELLERIEIAFAEGANHFWLDLQYYAYIAQEQAGEAHAAMRHHATADCGLLLKRLPGLENLLFDDGSPFADSATLEWIARHASGEEPRATAPSPLRMNAEAATDWAETETKALELAHREGLDNAFAWLHNLAGQDSERQRFMRQLVMARIAGRSDRADIATHLLSALDVTAEQHRLSVWEPTLAFDVKQQLLRVLKMRIARKDADKPTLARRIDTLLGELTAIDPARAVTLQ